MTPTEKLADYFASIEFPASGAWPRSIAVDRDQRDQIVAALRASTDRAITVPTKDQIRKAICCPTGCVREGDCFSSKARYVPPAVVEALAALLSPQDGTGAGASVTLSPPTPDQEAYLRNIQERTGKYDPTVVVGGPDRRGGTEPTTTQPLIQTYTPALQQIAVEIVLELDRLIDEFLVEDNLHKKQNLGIQIRQHLWDNKVGVLRVAQAVAATALVTSGK